MTRNRILHAIALLGALASIVAALDAFVLKSAFIAWFVKPITIPTWGLPLLFCLMLVLVIVSGRLRGFYVQQRTIPSDANAVIKYVLSHRLLEKSSQLDLYHYTAETLVIPWRDILEKHPKSLSIRLLVRRPEADPRKHLVAEGSLDTVKEISRTNPNITIDVRFFDHEPLLRLQFYCRNGIQICLTGVYRYDSEHPMRFVGAENNTMVILRSDRQQEEDAIKALHSRFEYEWSRLSPLRGVIFDMDGTLVNSMGLHLQAWREAFRSARIPIDEEEFRKDVYRLEGLEAEQTVCELLEKYQGKEPAQKLVRKIVDAKRQLHLQLAIRAEPFESVLELLDHLKSRGVPLGVVTGTPREVAESTIERHFPGRFRVIVSGSDVTKGKPDALPFLRAVEQLRIGNQDQCLAVENAPLGVRAAVAAGIPVFGILMDSPLEPSYLREVGARRVFSSHSELLSAISTLRFGELYSPNKGLQKKGDAH